MEYSEILEMIANKDPKGLEALYISYGEKFFGYAVTKWKLDEDRAWEIIYKTLETLILKLPDYAFESKAHFENFIFKVFINYLRQNYRSSQKEKHQVVHMDLGNISLGGGQSSNEIEITDVQSIMEYHQPSDSPKMQILKEALGKLDEIDRNILLLRAQDYSYGEIASFLNLQDDQLKVRHFRAKQKLLNLLQTQSNKTI